MEQMYKQAGFLPWFHIVNTMVQAHVCDSCGACIKPRLVNSAHFLGADAKLCCSNSDSLIVSAGIWTTFQNIGLAFIGQCQQYDSRENMVQVLPFSSAGEHIQVIIKLLQINKRMLGC